jgi:hypothetical protein
VRLGKQHARKGWFRFRAYKNRNRHPVDLEIPILPELQAIIDASAGQVRFAGFDKRGKRRQRRI